MAHSASLAARRILIVDDQESIRGVLRAALVEAGAEVLEAGNGAAGVEAATHKLPDLILLDIAMPGMNGWQVLEALRSVDETSEIPVVLETSSGDFPSYEQARRFAVAAFISKPFRLADVVETCRRILGGARPLMGRGADRARRRARPGSEGGRDRPARGRPRAAPRGSPLGDVRRTPVHPRPAIQEIGRTRTVRECDREAALPPIDLRPRTGTRR
jgi:two-component system, chemotaxis family, chemotaxis protein CheY